MKIFKCSFILLKRLPSRVARFNKRPHCNMNKRFFFRKTFVYSDRTESNIKQNTNEWVLHIWDPRGSSIKKLLSFFATFDKIDSMTRDYVKTMIEKHFMNISRAYRAKRFPIIMWLPGINISVLFVSDVPIWIEIRRHLFSTAIKQGSVLFSTKLVYSSDVLFLGRKSTDNTKKKKCKLP